MALHDFRATLGTGEEQSLAAYRGQALLIVNVASKCGQQGFARIHHCHADARVIPHIQDLALADHGLGVGLDIYPKAHQIARRGRAEQRDKHIKAFAHTPNREGLAHILGMAVHIITAPNIHNSTDPDGGIDDEAAKCFA